MRKRTPVVEAAPVEVQEAWITSYDAFCALGVDAHLPPLPSSSWLFPPKHREQRPTKREPYRVAGFVSETDFDPSAYGEVEEAARRHTEETGHRTYISVRSDGWYSVRSSSGE